MLQSTGILVQTACTSNPCQWNKGKKEQKIHKNDIKMNKIVPVKGKNLMNFINMTQDQKNLEVMLMLGDAHMPDIFSKVRVGELCL